MSPFLAGPIAPRPTLLVLLAGYPRKVPLVCDTKRHEIRVIDAQLLCDAMDLAFFSR